MLALINTELIPTYEIKWMTEKLWTFFHNKKKLYFYTFMNNYRLVSLRKLKDFYGHIDSFCSGLPNIVFFYSTLTSLSLLFCLFLYICYVVELEFSVQNGVRATEATPSGCYPKSIGFSPLGLLYSLSKLKLGTNHWWSALVEVGILIIKRNKQTNRCNENRKTPWHRAHRWSL